MRFQVFRSRDLIGRGTEKPQDIGDIKEGAAKHLADKRPPVSRYGHSHPRPCMGSVQSFGASVRTPLADHNGPRVLVISHLGRRACSWRFAVLASLSHAKLFEFTVYAGMKLDHGLPAWCFPLPSLSWYSAARTPIVPSHCRLLVDPVRTCPRYAFTRDGQCLQDIDYFLLQQNRQFKGRQVTFTLLLTEVSPPSFLFSHSKA